MANISSSKAEQIGNYRRRYLNGRFYWITNDNKYIDREVRAGNWILKPDGTKVHVTARLVNTQAARLANIQANKLDQNFDGYYVFPNPQDPNNLTTSQLSVNQAKRRVILRRPNYALNFNNLNLSDVERKYIENAGFNPDDARSVQEFILSKSKNANLGARKGAGKSDGYWGKKSAAAFLALRDQNIFTPIVDEQKQSAPVVEQPIDAPDPFGYKTSNTYEDDDFVSKLKRMGIRSNADLMHFMYESGKEGWKGNSWQTQFRNDVDKALDGDYSDANIRKTFNTKNDWGRGFLGGGDFGDFQNVLQTNAGVWNGIYELKQNNARMDAARQQYANKLAQQYTPLLPKPSLNKPMIGNIGINTIGNQLGLSDIWAGPDGIV